MKITLANVKYSQNLGDGLLSECLEGGLRKSGYEDFHITACDLAGRKKYSKKSKLKRAIALSILNNVPDYLRKPIVKTVLNKKARSWGQHYEQLVTGADAIVLGGGNLFTDLDMNFPTKISILLNIAKRRNVPVLIYGIGVGSTWSQAGLSVLKLALSGCTIPYVSVRDLHSQANFHKYFADAVTTKPIVVRDPGLIASTIFESREKNGVTDVGICITSPLAISYHSDQKISSRTLAKWYMRLIKRLKAEGKNVKLFTNGGEEDVLFADKLALMYNRSEKDNIVVYSAETPSELARFISSLTTLAAFRMHAIICAYSFGIRVAACKWDPKVEAFMGSVGHEDCLIDVVSLNSDEKVREILVDELSSSNNHLAVVREAEDDIYELAKQLAYCVKKAVI